MIDPQAGEAIRELSSHAIVSDGDNETSDRKSCAQGV